MALKSAPGMKKKLKTGQLWKDLEGQVWQLLRPARRKEPAWIAICWSDYGDDEEWQLPSEEIERMEFVRDRA